eukprot:m.148170 g.148170  ORF g.148170 m.148170 type:complete len:211 (-) comp30577_c1_seq1:288-920(-)
MSSIKIVLACVALTASVNAQCIDRDATCAAQIAVPIEQGGYDIRWCEPDVHYLSFYMRTWCQRTCDLCPTAAGPAAQGFDTTLSPDDKLYNEGGETGMGASSNEGGEGGSSAGGGGMGGSSMGGMGGSSMGSGSSGESGSYNSGTGENGNSYGYFTASAVNSDGQKSTSYMAVGGVVVLLAGLAGVSYRIHSRKQYTRVVDTESTENIIV